MKISKKAKVITVSVVAVLAIAGTGVYAAHQKAWLFTPVYSKRQTTQQFLADIYSGKTTDAYKLTSDVFLSNNSYDTFNQNVQNLTGSKMKTSYLTYATTKRSAAMSGTITSVASGERYVFMVDVVPTSHGNRVDSLDITQVN